jgi:regulatory factor X
LADCGIRPATTAEAEFLQDYIQKSNNNAGQSSINAARLASEQAEAQNRATEDGSGEDDDDDSDGNHSAAGSKRNSLVLSNDVKTVVYADDLSDKTPTAATLLSQAQAQRPGTYPSQASIRRHPGQEPILGSVQTHSPQSLGSTGYAGGQSAISVRQFPHFPSIDEAVGANSTSTHGIAGREVWNWFQDHLDALLDTMRTFRFDQFEMHLRTFWSNLGGNHREVVHAPAIAGLMAKADAIVYDVRVPIHLPSLVLVLIFLQEVLEILRSQMLSPIPATSLTNLRQLALKMEKILLSALEGYGNTFVEPKVELGARFGHLICALSFCPYCHGWDLI